MRCEALVAGGGPAGAACALTLARAGRDITLVEREAHAQHKVCGEFLSREALASLHALGVDPASHGAMPISAVRLASRRVVAESPLPFAAMSLTRRCLDELLLNAASKAGVRVLRGRSVESITHGTAVLAGGETVQAEAVFVATGKHDMRGRPRPAGRQGNLVAFKMYFRLTPEQAAALAGYVELILYPGGYAGLQLVEDGSANLCCLIDRRELRGMGGGWQNFLAAMLSASPHLRARLQNATPLLERPLAISSIPYGFVRPSSDGLWWLGDQAAVIPSFTGDGMSIALDTAQLAAQMYLNGEPAGAFQRHAQQRLSRQVGFATLLSRGLIAQPGVLALAAKTWPGAMSFIAQRTRIAS